MTTPLKSAPAIDVETAGKSSAIAPLQKYHEARAHLRGHVGQIDELMAHYPDSVRDDALWLRHYCATHFNNEHALIAKVAASLGIDQSDNYWYQILTGRYFKPNGSAAKLKEYIGAIRAWAIARAAEGKIPFVETKNWRLVRDYIDRRRAPGSVLKFGAIEGLTGSQKTHCTKHFRDLNNHLKTVHMEAPAKATRGRFVHKLARSYLLPANWTSVRKELEIESIVNADRTIIIDNIQRLFRPDVKPDQQPIFNYLHELQDDTGCTMIFSWVPTFHKTITSADPFWRQFLARIGGEDQILRLDQKLPKADLLAFARAFGVANDAAALPILRRWAESDLGIRILTARLEAARLLANARKSAEIPVGLLNAVETEPLDLGTDNEGEE